MQTVCPICHTIFRIAAAALHDSDGMVQCGVCGMVFNAHAHWIETTVPIVTADSPGTGTLEPEVSDPVKAPADIGADLPVTITTEQPVEKASAEPESESDTLRVAVVDPAAIAAPATEQIPPSDPETLSLPEPDSNAVSYADKAGPEYRSHTADAPSEYLSPGRASESRIAEESLGEADVTNTNALLTDEAADDEKSSADYVVFPPLHKNKRPVLFTALSSSLIFLLLLQIGYLYRNLLASQLPQSKPVLMSLCKVVGCTIALPRAIDALKLSSSELITNPSQPALLNVSFGLENLSNTAVAYPSISLALINDTGEIVVKRNFKPQDYSNQAAISPGIAPGDEISGKLTLKLDQISVSNYKILLYYP